MFSACFFAMRNPSREISILRFRAVYWGQFVFHAMLLVLSGYLTMNDVALSIPLGVYSVGILLYLVLRPYAFFLVHKRYPTLNTLDVFLLITLPAWAMPLFFGIYGGIVSLLVLLGRL